MTGAPARRRRAPEKVLDLAAMRALRALGFIVTRLQQARPSKQTAGVPDLYAVHVGWRLAVWIELKAPGRKLSSAQAVWHEGAEAAGVNVLTIWSVDELLAGLRDLGAPIAGPPLGRGR